MKKILYIAMMLSLCFLFTACSSGKNTQSTKETSKQQQSESTNEDKIGSENISDEKSENTLVAYFSNTGNTKAIATHIAEGLGADIYGIVPEEPYTAEDLNYNNDNSRSTLEMDDPSARPAISGSIEDIDKYDTIYLGYPIWWGEAPRIISTFVESYDFEGKTIIPFCTSGGSGLGSSATKLEEAAGSGEWKNGARFSGFESADEVMDWVNQF